MDKRLPPSFSRGESLDRPSEFFVETLTPKNIDSDGEEGDDALLRLQRAVTMGDPNAQVDYLYSSPAEIDIKLLPKKLLVYVLIAVAFYVAFTVVFFIGIPVDTVYENPGMSKKSEDLVETYNTYSGYVMALVEVFVAMHTDKFMPVIEVYVHNALYFLRRGKDGKSKSQSSRRLHTVLVFLFPIVLGLTMGNSLRGLQASQSSEGFKRIMREDDMKIDEPVAELLKAKNSASKNAVITVTADVARVGDTILRNAIRQRSMPFMFDTKSSCGLQSRERKPLSLDLKINPNDVDSTSAVYGFAPQEWNSEAISTELKPISRYTITYQNVTSARNKSQTIDQPTDFSVATAYEMLVQLKIMIERAAGDATTATYNCSDSDGQTQLDNITSGSGSGDGDVDVGSTGTKKSTKVKKLSVGARVHKAARRRLQEGDQTNEGDEDYEDYEEDDEATEDTGNAQPVPGKDGKRVCQGVKTSLFNMSSFYTRSEFKVEDLVIDATKVIADTIPAIAEEETEIVLEKYALTDQIQVEAMRIDIPMDATVKYGLNGVCDGKDAGCESIYSYDSVQSSFCGSDGCAFLDNSSTYVLQREIGVLSYASKCNLDLANVQYSPDFHGFYPSKTACTKPPNTALLYGFGSYISGEEYGSDGTKFNVPAPYIIAPRRRMRFTVAKVTWNTTNLADAFNATCGVEKQHENCTGLSYHLESSGRYLFAGEAALPTERIMKADFQVPISLVQLNSPKLFISDDLGEVTLERVSKTNFKSEGKGAFEGNALSGSDCSMLIDSYLKHVNENSYFLERPLQIMYTSFFYFFMENAAVTQLNDTTVALKTTGIGNTTATPLKQDKVLAKDKLGNVKLTGDVQVRNIRVATPANSFYTTLGGCVFILIMMVLILFVPARRVEYFDEGASTAQQFIAMRASKVYPDSVLHKTLLFPATNESVPFHDVEVERSALVHQTDRRRTVFL